MVNNRHEYANNASVAQYACFIGGLEEICYYICALCNRALLENKEHVRTYQAKPVLPPVIQKQFEPGWYDPKHILKEMRGYVIGTTIAGIRGGPGSGISVKL